MTLAIHHLAFASAQRSSSKRVHSLHSSPALRPPSRYSRPSISTGRETSGIDADA